MRNNILNNHDKNLVSVDLIHKEVYNLLKMLLQRNIKYIDIIDHSYEFFIVWDKIYIVLRNSRFFYLEDNKLYYWKSYKVESEIKFVDSKEFILELKRKLLENI